MRRGLSIFIVVTIVIALFPTTSVEAGVSRPAEITQPIDEFSPYRESEHFLFDIPSSYMRGKITPEQLGWYLGEMDKLYEAMADFVNWYPSSYQKTGDPQKILMNYDFNEKSAIMTAWQGYTQMNYSSSAVMVTIDCIKDRQVVSTPVHELGHNFGTDPRFNDEWTADFLRMFAAISTETTLYVNSASAVGNNGTLDSWYQAQYKWQSRTDIDWSMVDSHNTTYSTRYRSILNCAILNFVRDNGWEAISKTFGSYHDGSYPYDGQRYGGTIANIRFNEFIDRIDYFGDVDFRAEYLDNEDWLEYINGLFPVAPIGFVRIGDKDYATHTVNLQLSGKNLTDDDIEVLDQMTNLMTLNLRNNPMINIPNLISVLSRLMTVTHFTLDNNEITDISPLSELTNLNSLHLDSNKITDLSHLGKMINLEHLYLRNNQITDLFPLEELTNLKYLYLQNNQITDLSPLKKLTNLEYLYLFNNPISLKQMDEFKKALPNCKIIHNPTEDGCSVCLRLPKHCICPTVYIPIKVISDMLGVNAKVGIKPNTTFIGKDGKPIVVEDPEKLTVTVNRITPKSNSKEDFFKALLE